MTEREQLEQAIAHMESQRATLGDAVIEASIAVLREKLAALESPAPEQQRKQVTVLFAAVPGLAAVGTAVGGEDTAVMVNALWRQLDQAIVGHGGVIDKHMEDGVMALWGVEVARENDPERAIRAALAMQEEVRDLTLRAQHAAPLRMHVGINTGPVLLGTVGTTGEYTAMGDAVNLAKRLQEAAPAGRVLVSHDTYRHVRGVFELRPLQPLRMKGRAEPVQTYVVGRAKPRAFRVGTRGVEGIETAMIGREVQLKSLQDAWHAAVDGRGGVVTVTGEAGLGKSRLLFEFNRWLKRLPHVIRYLRGRASPEMQGLPYALVRDVLFTHFQVRDSDRAEVVRQKVEAGIGQMLGTDERGRMRAHFIGQLLGVDWGDSPHLRSALGDAQQIRDRALIYLAEFLRAAAAAVPMAVFLEDIHWADDSSLEAIEHLARAMLAGEGQSVPMLIVCLARPTLFERRPDWGERLGSLHARLALLPLSEEDSRRLVAEILQKVQGVPPALGEMVVGGAEGNPFYVEELIKMLIEDGVIVRGEDGEPWRVELARLTAVRVPPTLTGVIQARLDSLPAQERMALQQASVVGRIFWDSAVMRIQELVGERVDVAVAGTFSSLQGREMIFQRSSSAFSGTAEYIFKHAVLREVTYESVLKRLRRAYHGIVAEWLIEHSGDRAGEYAGLIAEHLDLAEQGERAAFFLRQAGEQAARQWANSEALSYFGRALERIPETDDQTRYEVLLARERTCDVLAERELQVQDLAALQALVGLDLATAVDVVAPQPDRPLVTMRRAEVALRQANYAQVTSDFPAAIAASQVAIDLARLAQVVVEEALAGETEGDKACRLKENRQEVLRLQAAGHLQWGQGLWRVGDFEAARPCLERALDLARQALSRQLEADSMRILGNVHYYRGDYAQAQSHFERSLPISREIGDRRGAGSTLNNLGEIARSQGNYPQARVYYEQRRHISREIGDPLSENIALANLSLISHNSGDDEASREYARRMLWHAQRIGNRSHQGYAWTNLGHALHGLGRSEAADAYQQAVTIRNELGEHFLAMESLAGLARLALSRGDEDQALAHVEQILLYLETNSLDGTDEPLRIYLTCYQVLRARQDPRAREILTSAYNVLQERAARIGEAEVRRSFLEDVAAHREIIQAFMGGD